MGSSIGREADQGIPTRAGTEIAVASTKAYTAQLISVLMVALYLAGLRESIRADRLEMLINGLKELPNQVERFLGNAEEVKTFAELYGFNEDVFFIGRSLDYAVALEGALKLKEISYIHAEAYAAGELKHCTLALIIEGVTVIDLATHVDV